MEGRETGTPGYQRAADYVAAELRKLGVRPAFSSGYFQAVPFQRRAVTANGSSIELLAGNKSETVQLGEDAFLNARAEPKGKVTAPLVFVGYGLEVPERSYSDLEGLQLRGKVAVFVGGAPSELPSNVAALHQTGSARWKALRRAGAIGAIAILNPAAMEMPWPRVVSNNSHPILVLGAGLNEVAGQRVAVTWNPAHAAKLFEGSGTSWEDILKLAGDGKRLPRLDLKKRLEINTRVTSTETTANNVAAVLLGSDETLRSQYVVVSAHLDHLGAHGDTPGDSIFNGTIDNAAGVATVLELARSLSEMHLKRSVLFVLYTGEESGMLGSHYFVSHGAVPLNQVVANVNMDNFKPIVVLQRLTVIGFGESDLGEAVTRSAKPHGVVVEDDQEPQ
jgi:Zn-dependent M28 family amino/carboxypeptidase